jgi:FHA domain
VFDETFNNHRAAGDEATAVVQDAQALGPREAFLVAFDRISSLAGISAVPAVIVAVVTPRARVLEAVLVEDGRTLILGRHSRCGLRVGKPAMALRQLALLVRAEEGKAVSRIWDLSTGAPFFTEDGQANEAVIADGPLYVALHGHAVWVVPSSLVSRWSSRASEAWASLPRRDFIDRRPAAGAAVTAPRRTAPPTIFPRAPQPDSARTRVTAVGAPLLLGGPEEIEVGWGDVRLECGGDRLRHRVSAERLERGVLVGRYDRCGLEIHDPERRISRVHVLLVKIGGDVWAIDAASTNGVFRGDVHVDAAILGDTDTLSLGHAATLRWTRHRHAEA